MKILIADDDDVIRQVMMNLLGKWGYGVVPTTNGAEAWEVLQNDPTLRVGIFDWFMPEMNGLQLTALIRSQNFVPFYIMLVTNRGGKESMVEGLEAGADDFVTKPFDKEILEVRLKVAVRSVEQQSQIISRLASAEAAVRLIPQLKNFLAICSLCGDVRDLNEEWHKLDLPIPEDTGETSHHKCCPSCAAKMARVKG